MWNGTVKLADVNVWLALAITGHEHHLATRRWLNSVSSDGVVLICRSTQQSFLRLLTTAAVFRPYGVDAVTNAEAWASYDAFSADPRVGFCHEPAGLEETWRTLVYQNASSPKLWMDAYLAAFASAAGYQLVTTDTAFLQFPELDVIVIEAVV